jgi:hypothetical protein
MLAGHQPEDPKALGVLVPLDMLDLVGEVIE